MAELNDLLALFWRGIAVHLWQTTLALLALALLAGLLRRAPARLVNLLWWIALAKLFLPLAALEPLVAASARSIAGSWPAPGGPAAARVVEYIRVVLNPTPWSVGAPGPGHGFYPLLTLIWLAGMIFVLARWRRRATGRLEGYPRTLAASRGPLCDKLAAAIADTGIPAERIRIGSVNEVPAVAGLVRPQILVSERVVEALDEQELRAVLLHEESHRRRGDPACAFVQRVALLLFFFYPPVWWVVRRLKESAELACDESVLAAGVAPAIYVRALARALSLELLPSRIPAAVGLGHRRGLRRRLERIDDPWRYRMMHRHRWVLVAAVLLVIGPLLPVALSAGVAGQNPPGARVVEPSSGASSRFADLDRLEDAEVVLRLNFRDIALEQVFESLEQTSGLRVHVEGPLPLCDEIDLGPVTLKEVLVHLALKHDLIYDVEEPKTLRVRAPRFAGLDGVSSPRLIPEFKVNPVYPEAEKKERVEGRVFLEAVILRDGSVSSIRPLQEEVDHPAFTESAIAAVRQWRYEPATLDGRPVEVYFTVEIQFSLH